MLNLLQQYHNEPSLKLAQKVRAYARKHPFSACLLQREEQDLLSDAIHHANKG